MSSSDQVAEAQAFAQLERRLGDAGMTLKESYSSSSVQGRDGETEDYVHRTHELMRDGRRVGELVIDRWSRKARLVKCHDPMAAAVTSLLGEYTGSK